MRRVRANGIEALDGRTVAVKAVMAWKNALVADLGGEENVSTQRLALVDSAVRTKLFLDHVDAFLMQQECLLNRKRKSVIPALRERQILVDCLSRLLVQLGLQRVPKPVGTLADFIRDFDGKKNRQDEPEPPEANKDEPPEAASQEQAQC